MNRAPQIVKRKVGAVDIIDLRGEFVGHWALRGKEEIASFLKSRNTKSLLINLRGLITLDSLGAKAITENLRPGVRSGLVAGNLTVMEMLSRVAPSLENVKWFRNEEEIIHYFGEDLVQWNRDTYEEKRKHVRLKTALPLEFSFQDEKGDSVFFRAVVTDLSEGGLFAEYLDLDEPSFSKLKLNPYDFQMLDLKLKLPGSLELFAKGKVVRVMDQGDQVGMGIEFYEISDENRRRVANFIS